MPPTEAMPDVAVEGVDACLDPATSTTAGDPCDGREREKSRPGAWQGILQVRWKKVKGEPQPQPQPQPQHRLITPLPTSVLASQHSFFDFSLCFFYKPARITEHIYRIFLKVSI